MTAITFVVGVLCTLAIAWLTAEVVEGWPSIVKWVRKLYRRWWSGVARVNGRGLAWVPYGKGGLRIGQARVFRWVKTVGFSIRRAVFRVAMRSFWQATNKLRNP